MLSVLPHLPNSMEENENKYYIFEKRKLLSRQGTEHPSDQDKIRKNISLHTL